MIKNTEKTTTTAGARPENVRGEWGVWCECSGMLGTRVAWLKTGKDSVIRQFETEADAQAEAQRITGNLSPYSSATFRYFARRFNEAYAD